MALKQAKCIIVVLGFALVVAGCSERDPGPTMDVEFESVDWDSLDQESQGQLPAEWMLQYLSDQLDPASASVMRSRVRIAFATLYYPVDLREPDSPLTSENIGLEVSLFQEALGSEVDGVLKVHEMMSLLALANVASSPTVTIGSVDVSIVAGNFATAEGTLTFDGAEREAHPINYHWIECNRESETCTQRAIEAFSFPDPQSPLEGNFNYLFSRPATAQFDIISWNDRIVVARAGNPEGCRFTTLTINGETEQTTMTLENGSASQDECYLPPLEAPRTSQLVGPIDRSSEFARDRYSALSQYWGPELPEGFLEQMEAY